MMNMGYTTGNLSLWSTHMLGMAVASLFVVGLVLLILWAAKTMTHKQLLHWGIGLIVVSAVLCALTFDRFGGRMLKMRYDNGVMPMHEMMEGMMDEHDEHGDNMMEMSMSDMSGMLQGKSGDAFDRAFIEGMIPHHQGAIDMARAALRYAKHQEIKDMAEAIIEAQQSEIDMMNSWMMEWGYAG